MIWICNGGFVPFIYFLILSFTDDYLLSAAMTIRLFTINYFFWFVPWTIQQQLRQCVRFTDSQTLLCVLNYYIHDARFEQITFNILAIVSFGFWIGYCCGIDEQFVKIPYPFMQEEISNLYHYINHGMLFLILFFKIISSTPQHNIEFYVESIKNTFLYVIMYIMIIYIPWFFITGDTIYNLKSLL